MRRPKRSAFMALPFQHQSAFDLRFNINQNKNLQISISESRYQIYNLDHEWYLLKNKTIKIISIITSRLNH
ncbi:hypothetical protein ACMV_10000 [Acidiphilium multivorum AIU301]|uniref:Uncharacterized protein n=1 Tax=Acidiphilium multivorum (strain DSM 11245 / JCM 8867 / NBRC 100883 / AIU 301) TaxID=926570 RepID=F0J691_ACIMA|nr:hypothetical protein ACMV_10000 [Acidiphilium multivorum AIU301]